MDFTKEEKRLFVPVMDGLLDKMFAWESSGDEDEVRALAELVSDYIVNETEKRIKETRDDLIDDFETLCEETYHNATTAHSTTKRQDEAKSRGAEVLGSEEAIDNLVNDRYWDWLSFAQETLMENLVEDLREKFGGTYKIDVYGRNGATWVIDEIGYVFDGYAHGNRTTLPSDDYSYVREIIEVQTYLNEIIKRYVNDGLDYFMADQIEQIIEDYS